ncbi:MAG: dicarboxylate/amino acid:cation symporter [Gemmatimonadota bacterium]
MMKSLGARVLLALVLGLAAGIAVSSSGNPDLVRLVGWIEPIGTLWINAIRMTVIPLVLGAIIVGIASAPELKTIGSVGGRAVAMFFAILLAAAFFSVLVAPAALSFLHIDPQAAAALRASASEASASALEGAQKIQSARQWLIDLVPINPVKAAADGAMLPLIIFAVAFGMALTRVTGPARETFLNFARALTDASLVLVRWILAAAPIGVFALTVAVALKLGLAAAGAVIFYTALVCVMCSAFIALLYLLTWSLARARASGFARFWAPAQAVAFSSRSSLVALPAMIESAASLKQPLVIRSFFLPLAVATFRTGSAINIPIGVLFAAHLYGVDVSAAQLLTIAITTVVTTFSVPGIPGGSIIVMVPVLLAAGLPVEGIGILLAVDTLPDMFRTMTNVTGDLAVAAVLSTERQPPGSAG